MERQAVIESFQKSIGDGKPIVGTGAGTGLSAKSAEAGGADLIIIYNSGRYRMAGRGSAAGLMPYGDANAIVVEMAAEVLPLVKRVPVLAGVCGTDPFRIMPLFLHQLKELGFTGVQNFPTVGLHDGIMRQNFEETGMGFGLEVDMIHHAHDLDLLTCPYVFNEDEAVSMTQAGADIIVAHMGVTSSGTIGAHTTMSLDDAVARIQKIGDAAKRIQKDIMVLCHGGPIAEPEDAAFVLARTDGIVGFFGASSAERLPTERAVSDQVRRFKSIQTRVELFSAQDERTRQALGSPTTKGQ
jgi:predicted TIM-barrel enzyme